MTGITYGGVATDPASFGYDEAGNRTSMTDGLGSVSYVFDTQSRLTSETRSFTGLGSYTLGYGYNLAGQVTSITDPFNASVSYQYNKAGELIVVGGGGYAGLSQYTSQATPIKYRAWGGLKYADGGRLPRICK